jgi:NAD+ diphosphatase
VITTGYAFIDGALDRAEHLRDDPDALAQLWPDARVLSLDAEGRAPTDTDGQPRLLNGAECASTHNDALFLGLDTASRAWFARTDDADTCHARLDLRSAAMLWPAPLASAFAEARALQHWQRRHRHCGACGARLQFQRAGWQGHCPACGSEHYPRTDPAIIAAVSDGERLLLARQSRWPPRRYSVIAGYVEPGESLEQTVLREVFEETGLHVTATRYLASQPWPFPSALMLGFHATVAPGALKLGHELEDARWVDIATLADALANDHADAPLRLSQPLSIARWLIEAWYRDATA